MREELFLEARGQSAVTGSGTGLSYETRELAWELSQERTDGQRIQFLLETGGDLAAALALAEIPAQQVLRDPRLRRLNLRRHLRGPAGG